MRQSRFADEQTVAIVREADREPVADLSEAARCERADDLCLGAEAPSGRWRRARCAA